MAYASSPFDWMTRDWSAEMAQALADGTVGDYIETEMIPDPEADPPVTAAEANAIATAEFANLVSSFMRDCHEAFEGMRAFRLRETGGPTALTLGAIADGAFIRRNGTTLSGQALAAVASTGSASDLSAGTLPAARFDDTAHGSRAGGSLHADVIAAGASGFMSGADKTKLDGLASTGFGVYPTIVADIDFTAEATATPTLNQVVSYGGLSFTWQRNTGGTELSLADVLNGTGLRLLYKSSGAGSLDISASNDTAGGIYFSLGSLPGFSERHRYLVLWHVDQAGGVANAWATSAYTAKFSARVISASGVYAGTSQFARGGGWGSNSGGAAAPSCGVYNGATGGVIRTGMPPTTYNVIGLAPIMGGAAVTVVAGIYSGGWPSVDSLLAVGSTDAPGVGNGSQCPCNLSITRMGVWLTGNAGVANPHGVTIRGLRVYDLGPQM